MRTPKMTRAHFYFIAEAIAEQLDKYPHGSAERSAVREMAYSLARKLRTTNPSFNYDRFVSACGCSSNAN